LVALLLATAALRVQTSNPDIYKIINGRNKQSSKHTLARRKIYKQRINFFQHQNFTSLVVIAFSKNFNYVLASDSDLESRLCTRQVWYAHRKIRPWMKEVRDKTWGRGGLPTLPGLFHSTFQPSRRGFFWVHTCV
jgi:hypothetical protein